MGLKEGKRGQGQSGTEKDWRMHNGTQFEGRQDEGGTCAWHWVSNTVADVISVSQDEGLDRVAWGSAAALVDSRCPLLCFINSP